MTLGMKKEHGTPTIYQVHCKSWVLASESRHTVSNIPSIRSQLVN